MHAEVTFIQIEDINLIRWKIRTVYIFRIIRLRSRKTILPLNISYVNLQSRPHALTVSNRVEGFGFETIGSE